ncbi:MAG: SUMF1/EgtB/PvdO family nonheme iron enzyme [Bacteroidota bacterium]
MTNTHLCSYTENIKDFPLEMIYIQGGNFLMGGKYPVTLRDYYLTRYPVSQGLWEIVTGENPARFPGDALPVERVSWNDAQAFLEKLNAMLTKEGKEYQYTLPTEAQWEYAARGGIHQEDHSLEYTGSDKIEEVAWYGTWDNSEHQYATTMPPGLKAPNALGLYDMSGNVREWCADWYDLDYYENSPLTDPKGPPGGSYRVIRGGSWRYSPGDCRVVDRDRFFPDSQPFNLGFRLSRAL